MSGGAIRPPIVHGPLPPVPSLSKRPSVVRVLHGYGWRSSPDLPGPFGSGVTPWTDTV